MKGSSDLSCCMFGIREMSILGNWHRLIGKVIYVIKGQIEEGCGVFSPINGALSVTSLSTASIIFLILRLASALPCILYKCHTVSYLQCC